MVLLCKSTSYLLFKAGELQRDRLIDPPGNDFCPGLTFNPLEKSILPIPSYLLFVKHSRLEVTVKISLAACRLLLKVGLFPCIQQCEASGKGAFPLLPLGKYMENLCSGMQQVCPSLVTPFYYVCCTISSLEYFSWLCLLKGQARFRYNIIQTSKDIIPSTA